MSDSRVAIQLQGEHALVDQLASRLRESVAIVPRANHAHWINETRTRFEHLRAHLNRQFALEERDGYMTAVVARRPALSTEVDRLAHEHLEILRLLDDLQRALDSLAASDPLLIRDWCARALNILQYLEHHEKDENLLVTFVFVHDIGTKD